MEHYPVNLPDSFLEDVVKAIRSNDPCAMAIYLFGSYARGEEHPASDVDIYVITKDICSFIPDEGREAARKAFRQLIEDYGLNPSVLTYGPLRDFAERIHIVAFEERSVWTEGIALWESEDYRRQARRFGDEIVPSDIYREEIYDYGKRAHFYWRCLHRVEGEFRIPEEKRLSYELAFGRYLAHSVVRMFNWIREANGVKSLPKQPLSDKIAECVERGWIDSLPSEVSDAVLILEKYLINGYGAISAEDHPQGITSIEELPEYSHAVERFLQDNGYRVPIWGTY